MRKPSNPTSVGSRSRGAARGAWGGATPPEMVWTRPHGGMERIETISGGRGSPRHPTATVGTKRRRQLVPVDSTISGSPEEPAALDATGSMTNDLRCCETRKLC